MNTDQRRAPGLDWIVLLAGLIPSLVLAVLFRHMLAQVGDAGLRTAIAVRDIGFLWTGGLLARAGNVAAVFDPHAFQAEMTALAGSRLTGFAWSYPPPLLFLAIPTSFLSPVAAFAAWAVGGSVLVWFAARSAGLGWTARLLAVVSPAALENALSGQNGSLTAALMLPGLALLDRRPWLAGALLGGLVIKPQLAAVVPVCMLASRNWRAAAAAALSASALAAASLLAFGGESWAGFLLQTAPFMRRTMLEADWFSGPYQSMIATPFMAARWAGAPLEAAYAIQAVSALVAASLCWRAWRAPSADPLARVALTLALTFLASPYGMSYDMTALSAALIGLACRDGRWRSLPRFLFALAWIWPGCGFLLGAMRAPPLGLAAVVSATALAGLIQRRVAAAPSRALSAAAA